MWTNRFVLFPPVFINPHVTAHNLRNPFYLFGITVFVETLVQSNQDRQKTCFPLTDENERT